MRKRRKFTAEKKAQVALAVLSGARTSAQVCREQQLKPELVSRWKQELVAGASLVFDRERSGGEQQARIAELERLVGRLTMQLEIAKKASRLTASRVFGGIAHHSEATAGDESTHNGTLLSNAFFVDQDTLFGLCSAKHAKRNSSKRNPTNAMPRVPVASKPYGCSLRGSCKKCGHTIRKGAQFCPECGAPA